MYHAFQQTYVGWQQVIFQSKPEQTSDGSEKGPDGSGMKLRNVTKVPAWLDTDTCMIFNYYGALADEQRSSATDKSD